MFVPMLLLSIYGKLVLTAGFVCLIDSATVSPKFFIVNKKQWAKRVKLTSLRLSIRAINASLRTFQKRGGVLRRRQINGLPKNTYY